MIETVWVEVTRAKPEDQATALRRFIERVAKVSHLKFLTGVAASKVINAMKAMSAREVAPEVDKISPQTERKSKMQG